MKSFRTLALPALAGAMALTLAACSGGGGGGGQSTQASTEVTQMKMLIGSSGDAETKAVQAAVDAWGQS